MRLKYLTCAFMLAMALPISISVASAETIVMKNGDRLTGDIVYKGEGRIDLQTDYGVLQIPMTDTLGYVQDRQFIMPPASTAASSDKNAPSKVAKSSKTHSKEADNKGLWGAKWSGDVNFGATKTSGNSDTSGINADASAKARWDKHRVEGYVEINREKDGNTETVDNQSLELSYDYFFAEKWFWDSSAEYEKDSIALLDLRSEYNMGLGHQVYERDDLNLKYILGGGYRIEEYTNGTDEEDMTVAWEFDYNQKFFDDFFRLFHKHDLSAPTDDFNAYIFESQSGARVPLKKGIVATAEVDFDWDNEPPTGAEEEDTTYRLKLGYEW